MTQRPLSGRVQLETAGAYAPEARRTSGRVKLITGIVLAALVLAVGLLAKMGPVARLQHHIDRHIAADDRTAALTALARAITTIATPETVGVGLMIALPVILILARRRLDALKLFCMFAGAFALVEVAKIVINEHRPPAALQAMKADASGSYPSGHTATAAVMALSLAVIATTLAWRSTAFVLGGLFTFAVAASRVYLADHYPIDVIGSMLCAAAAAFIVTGLAGLPPIDRHLQRLVRLAGRSGSARS